LLIFLTTSSIVFCQVSSNSSYPKTVTGIVDFGSGKFTVFTQEQKAKIVEKIIRLEDCEANAIADSIIISKFQNKSITDSAAISLCEKERDENKNMYDLCMVAVENVKEQLVKKDIDLKKSEKKAERQKLFKKIGAGIGTGLGVAGGFLAGYFGAKAEEKLRQ
jgi:hypothetical protein